MEPRETTIPGRVEGQFPEWTYRCANQLPEITQKVLRLSREARTLSKEMPKYGDWRDVFSFMAYWESGLSDDAG